MNPDQILHAYTRVSSASKEEEGTSLDTQKELGLKKSEQLGYRYSSNQVINQIRIALIRQF